SDPAAGARATRRRPRPPPCPRRGPFHAGPRSRCAVGVPGRRAAAWLCPTGGRRRNHRASGKPPPPRLAGHPREGTDGGCRLRAAGRRRPGRGNLARLSLAAYLLVNREVIGLQGERHDDERVRIDNEPPTASGRSAAPGWALRPEGDV